MKGKLTTVILILVFFVGLSLLLYPSISDYWNSLHHSRAITKYSEEVANLNDDLYDALWERARAYNETLLSKTNRYALTDEERAEYESCLSLSGTGVIGYIEITKIECYLPVYHGTGDAVLKLGVGHLEGTSLPAGGESTHCVLSGHRGLPSAKLFTDLDYLELGDTFLLYVLDEVLTYEVDQILIVDPKEIGPLDIVAGEDLCTLITCTPYGINTHRLLVRGHRIETEADKKTVRVTADAMQIEPVIVAPLVAVPMLALLLVVLLFDTRKRK